MSRIDLKICLQNQKFLPGCPIMGTVEVTNSGDKVIEVNALLPKGRHSFPFEFMLEEGCPSTFETKLGLGGHVQYGLKAFLKVPGKAKYTDSCGIRVRFRRCTFSFSLKLCPSVLIREIINGCESEVDAHKFSAAAAPVSGDFFIGVGSVARRRHLEVVYFYTSSLTRICEPCLLANLNLPQVVEGILDIRKFNQNGPLCVQQANKKVDVKVQLPKTGYLSGERIPVKVTITNLKGSSGNAEIAIVKRVELVSRKYGKSSKEDITLVNSKTWNWASGEWLDNLELPMCTPTNLCGAECIAVDYFVQVNVKGVDVFVPIVIGAIASAEENSWAGSPDGYQGVENYTYED
ncbi:Arrestin domain-containing protein 1 [Folsomia candida]|uniref:Arrestin domain-containing protein 1 n=1 Tax=Folsomia candida TaxID=158441 RepID=A0A226CZH1_FOLCA|nr:Arrestin domain-containing protein 1 [Folsomia candida]